MPNTTNYSFPTPADTDLVKNGADAIRDLGDAVDTAMNTALGTKKAGMVLLNTTSFSAVASQSFNNVFTTDYQNYKVIMRFVTSTTSTVQMRFRASGTDNSASEYFTSGYGIGTWSLGPVTSMQLAASLTASQKGIDLTVFSPEPAQLSLVTGDSMNSTNNSFYSLGNQISSTAQFDGFTVFPSAGTITGIIRVYGLAN
jgi:hypothetical protein